MTQLRLDIPDQEVFYTPPNYALPNTDWETPRLASMPSWANAKRICVDVETRDPDLKQLGPGVRRKGSYVVGVGFAIEDGPTHYLPIKHHGGGNCEGDVWGYIRDQCKNFRGDIIAANAAYDLDWMAEEGCDVLSRPVKDVLVADPLIYELYHRYDLEAVCNRWELPGKDETLLRQAAQVYRIDPKKELWKLPAKFVGRYCEIDCIRPLQVLRRQEKAIADAELEEVWKLEQAVTPILVKMRRRGVRIDIEHLRSIEVLSRMTEAKCLDEVRALTGITINVGDVWKAQVLAPALKAVGREVPLTPKTKKPSVDKTLLERSGKVGKAILRAREWNKLRTTFCAQVRRALIGDRVHCTFNQLRATDEHGEGKGVRYGRLSSSNFNLQQQPIRHDEYGEMWRSVFVPDLGAYWACSDWSQQEPRIGVHYAEKLRLPGAKEFGDAYRENPALDIHQKLADLSEMPRKIVKNFVNGRLYGMGDAKLCRAIKQPTEMVMRNGRMKEVPGPEGQAIIDKFNKFAPWVAGLTREAAKAAKKRGYVRTILGRRCNFEMGPDGYQFTHKAFNRVGQGSAADQMKATLVAADREGIPVQMSVHDEFDLSWTDEVIIRRLRVLQMETVKFSVPMKVDLEVGPSWGKLTKLK